MDMKNQPNKATVKDDKLKITECLVVEPKNIEGYFKFWIGSKPMSFIYVSEKSANTLYVFLEQELKSADKPSIGDDLRNQIADLERENSEYRAVYDSVVKNRDELRERVKELEDALTVTLNVARACDRGIFVDILDKAEKSLKK